MVTYYIGPDAVALGLNEAECQQAKSIVRQRLALEGIEPWERMETEIFALSGEYLLISRPTAPLTQRLSRPVPRLHRR